MNKSKVINYDSAIAEFLEDVKVWLDQRPVRDSTEVLDIKKAKSYWHRVCQNTRFYVRMDKLRLFINKYGAGFRIKTGVNQYDLAMYSAVFNVMYAMGDFYQNEGPKSKAKLVEALKEQKSKMELVEALKEYKKLRAANAFERLKISLTNPQKLFASKQK